MFVQRAADSCKPYSEPMFYGVDRTVEHLKSVMSRYQEDLEEMSQKVSEQQKALEDMKMRMEIASTELGVHYLMLQISFKRR